MLLIWVLCSINLANFNTKNVTNMSYMFYGCYSLSNVNLSNFKSRTSNNMSYMFYACKSLIKQNVITNDKKILDNYKIK